ncbi:MAG: trypsin-like peptidase domain-containing protein [Gemmatimonadaceae bacterium]
MTLELRVLSGACAGQRATFAQAVVTVGRHPACDFRFDPEQDREVSTRHAELRRSGDQWRVVDLRSTNGTYLNDLRVEGETELQAGDVLTFGTSGPRVEVGISADVAAEPPRGSGTAVRVSWGNAPRAAAPPAPALPRAYRAAPAASAPPAASVASAPDARVRTGGRTPTRERIAAAVHESTRGLRRMLVGVSVLLVLAVGGALAWSQLSARQHRAEIARLSQEVRRQQAAWDAQYRSMTGRLSSLDSAYQIERSRTEVLQQELEVAARRGSAAEIEALRRRIVASQSKTRGIVAAALMDPRKVNRMSGPGVVLVAVQQQDGQAYSGSGFNVLPAGLIVTNRHVVQDASGRAVKAIKVMFAGTKGAWLPARVVKVGLGREDDLALLAVDAAGTFPTVAGVTASRTSVDVGSPIATIGFPLGTDLAGLEGSIDDVTATPTLTAGTVSKLLPSVLQVDAYSGQGASGSPVFDEDGNVVGVIYGGAPGSEGRVVYAVPSERLIALLPPQAAAILR